MGRKMKIFLSCGQRDNEKEIGLKITKYFNNKYNDKLDIIFAEEIFDSTGLTDVIYKNLKESDGYIGILHKREKISKNKNIHRTSLFVNQELGIASYLRIKPFRIYKHKNVELEGINKFLMNRNIPFLQDDEILIDLKKVIKSWLSSYKQLKGLKFDEPNIYQTDHLGNKISQIILDININNQDPIIIENFQFGILIPKIIDENLGSHSDWIIDRDVELIGPLKNHFNTNCRIRHCKYNGVLNRLMSFNIKFSMILPKNAERFIIGFYLIDQNGDLLTYSMEFNNLDANNFSHSFNKGDKHEIKI